jgi:hypothetical protein
MVLLIPTFIIIRQHNKMRKIWATLQYVMQLKARQQLQTTNQKPQTEKHPAQSIWR